MSMLISRHNSEFLMIVAFNMINKTCPTHVSAISFEKGNISMLKIIPDDRQVLECY